MRKSSRMLTGAVALALAAVSIAGAPRPAGASSPADAIPTKAIPANATPAADDAAPALGDPAATTVTPAAVTIGTTGTPGTGATECSGRRPQAAGTVNRSLQRNGYHRTYVVHVPPGYDPTVATPVVVLLHGQASYGIQQLIYSGYGALADREGFLVLAPDTAYPTVNQWLIGSGPGATPWVDPRVDDVGFIRVLLDRLSAQFCVDTHRVFATGISSGGFMASYLACRLPGRIASVVTVAATVYSDDAEDCATPRPVPVLAFHGTADRNVPFDHQTFGVAGSNDGVVANVRRWATRRNGCTGASTVTQLAPDVSRRSWDCPSGQPARLVRIQGGGHTWPGSPIDVPSLGVTTRSVSATAMGWRFFEANPMP